jgi:hypothetical protein
VIPNIKNFSAMRHGQGFALIFPFQRLIWGFEKVPEIACTLRAGCRLLISNYQTRAENVNVFKTLYCSLFQSKNGISVKSRLNKNIPAVTQAPRTTAAV